MSELLLLYTAAFVFRMPYQGNYWLWKAIGFAGIGTFGTRFIVQWIYSEKHKESRIPVIFWWQSLFGTLLCLAYFLRQQDSVGIAGYVLNIIPYSRNLILVYRKRRLEAAGGLPADSPARL
jgi:lipid-A-disaccharide synthase-like uncharacterized protein